VFPYLYVFIILLHGAQRQFVASCRYHKNKKPSKQKSIPACESNHTGAWPLRARTGAARTPPWPPCTPQTESSRKHRKFINQCDKSDGFLRKRSNATYIERHELRRPGVERQRGLALVDAVAGEHPPFLRAIWGRTPVPLPPRRRGPRVEVIGVARGGDGARGEGGLPGGRDGRG
jgi:hypothetical protein